VWTGPPPPRKANAYCSERKFHPALFPNCDTIKIAILQEHRKDKPCGPPTP